MLIPRDEVTEITTEKKKKMETFLSLVLIAGLGIGFLAIAWESYSISMIALIVAFCVSDVTLATIGTFVMTNPALLITSSLIYVLVGVAWSFAKWFRYCCVEAERGKEAIAIAIGFDLHGQKNIVCNLSIAENQIQILERYKPRIYGNKSRISGWIAYWPLSIFWTVTNEFLRDFFEKIVKFFKLQYEAVADRAFRNV